MNLKEIKYKIHLVGYLGDEVRPVSGYAVGFPLARICVREIDGDYWQCDDYDTGYRIGDPEKSQAICIAKAIATLAEHIPTGRYKEQQKIAFARLKREGLIE